MEIIRKIKKSQFENLKKQLASYGIKDKHIQTNICQDVAILFLGYCGQEPTELGIEGVDFTREELTSQEIALIKAI